LPEGDCLSPILFAIFTADVEKFLHHRAPILGEKERKSIFFADDGAIIAISADELQKGIDNFQEYCERNHLIINADKTKVMVFGRGRIPKADFTIGEDELEIVKEFTYLGVRLSPQLSYSNHINAMTIKAKARIAYLYLRLPLYDMSLELVVKIFETYVLPIFTYCAPIYASNVQSQNAIQKLNAVFTNYLKRYLGLPKYALNAAIHYYCAQWIFHYIRRNN